MAGRVRGILENLLGRRREIALADVVGDTELLERFAATRDEAAFELLVWRHGTMVLGVCRRAVRDEQLAEDAFQAVFIVLARKAGSIRGGNVGGWLFRVARRVAARAARRRPTIQPIPELSAPTQVVAVESRELTEILDAEVSRLPDRLRRPVILCYLGGQTTEDAARELGCPRGTVLSRLVTARKRLAERLTRRGVNAPALGVAIADRTTGKLVSQTIAALQNPTHMPAASAPALLAESVVRAMATTKRAMVAGLVLLATGLTVGIDWVAAGTYSVKPQPDAGSVQAESPTVAQAKPTNPQPPKPPDRAAGLRKSAEEIAVRIERIQDQIMRVKAEPDMIGVSVLQSELFALDKLILDTERQARHYQQSLEKWAKEKQTVAKRELDPQLVQRRINEVPAVKEAAVRVDKAKATAASLKQKLAEDHPIMRAATKDIADAGAALTEAREKAKPEAERRIRNDIAKDYDTHIASMKSSAKTYAGNLDHLHAERGRLVARIAETNRTEARRQALQDELEVYRAIQLELLRQRTIAELGLESLPAAPRPMNDPRIDTQIKELKREIEVLRAEVEKLHKK